MYIYTPSSLSRRSPVEVVVVEGHADGRLVVPVVLADGLPRRQLPQAGNVVAGGRDQVGRVGREGAVPHPALVAVQLLVQRPALRVPDLDRRVGRAGGQAAHVGREQASQQVLGVRRKAMHRVHGGHVPVVGHLPHKAAAPVVPGHHHAPVIGHGHGAQGRGLLLRRAGPCPLRLHLVRALVLRQVPQHDPARRVAGHQLALVGMDDDVVDGCPMLVVALDGRGARVPDLDRPVLAAGDHPLALAMEPDGGDVAGVPLKGHHGARAAGVDVVELDGAVAAGCQEALVGRDAQPVDLAVGILDGLAADAAERLPEADRVVVAATDQDDAVCAHPSPTTGDANEKN